ncbi:predicted protein [Lichtheimia corymbifera JMRC:FSU:9682]|uniref:Uncharacterized protein n=1 Tax=Lichtheimia corymbifera JMRC:FSU:9682 TaxID=1263082 RepID=A0A068SHN2_9FUNG|nr:predicted protein [Lichtheimia corymbifera JMRC:FSU:9682]
MCSFTGVVELHKYGPQHHLCPKRTLNVIEPMAWFVCVPITARSLQNKQLKSIRDSDYTVGLVAPCFSIACIGRDHE